MFRRTIKEYEKGLKFKGGKIVAVLDSGKYWAWPGAIMVFDTREAVLRLPTQEILTKDAVNIRCTASLRYQIIDPKQYFLSVQEPDESIYLAVHESLRQAIAECTLEQLLDSREEVDKTITSNTASQLEKMGIKAVQANIRDMVLPKPIKDSYSETYAAKKLGQAQLEAARGQTAALRHMANAGKLIKENPELIKLLALQTADKKGGHTVAIGLNQTPKI